MSEKLNERVNSIATKVIDLINLEICDDLNPKIAGYVAQVISNKFTATDNENEHMTVIMNVRYKGRDNGKSFNISPNEKRLYQIRGMIDELAYGAEQTILDFLTTPANELVSAQTFE